jgi:GMP synthase (glutamine-hydrolysing)
MPSPRLLVIEGNSPQTMAEHLAAGGVPASDNYAKLLRDLLPGAHVDICYPADVSAALPEGQSLEGYDGVAITGSSLHLYNRGPAVDRQVDLVRAIFETGTPVFGSCWGLQVITTAAGGVVRKNPKGREIGFGRSIRLTDAGRKHPMYAGKMDVFNAPTVHLDEVVTLAPNSTLLSSNAVSEVQAIELKTVNSIAWGVQYHPEYPLSEVAAIVRRIGTRLIEEGFFLDVADITVFAEDLDALHNNPGDNRLAWRHGISKNVHDPK